MRLLVVDDDPGLLALIRTTESYDVSIRGDRALSRRIGLFLLGQYQRDPFAGLASRWSGGPGLAISLLRSARDTLGVEEAVGLVLPEPARLSEAQFLAAVEQGVDDLVERVHRSPFAVQEGRGHVLHRDSRFAHPGHTVQVALGSSSK